MLLCRFIVVDADEQDIIGEAPQDIGIVAILYLVDSGMLRLVPFQLHHYGRLAVSKARNNHQVGIAAARGQLPAASRCLYIHP